MYRPDTGDRNALGQMKSGFDEPWRGEFARYLFQRFTDFSDVKQITDLGSRSMLELAINRGVSLSIISKISGIPVAELPPPTIRAVTSPASTSPPPPVPAPSIPETSLLMPAQAPGVVNLETILPTLPADVIAKVTAITDEANASTDADVKSQLFQQLQSIVSPFLKAQPSGAPTVVFAPPAFQTAGVLPTITGGGGLFSGDNQYLLWGAIGLGVYFLFSGRKGKRR